MYVARDHFVKVDTAHDAQKTVTRTEAAGAQYFWTTRSYLPPRRPPALADPREREKVMRHIANVMEYLPVVTDRILQRTLDADWLLRR